MVPYATLRLRLFPHLRWGFANYSINSLQAISRDFDTPSYLTLTKKRRGRKSMAETGVISLTDV